jgi:hypothetical protein
VQAILVGLTQIKGVDGSCAASDPHQWRTGGLFANPMTTDIVNIHITNAGTASARVRLRFGVNAA